MAAKKPIPYTKLHRDGSIWAEGQLLNGEMHGYWEWYRKDGTKMRSGSFKAGERTGTWITYNKEGKPHKTTQVS